MGIDGEMEREVDFHAVVIDGLKVLLIDGLRGEERRNVSRKRKMDFHAVVIDHVMILDGWMDCCGLMLYCVVCQHGYQSLLYLFL